MRIAFWIGLMGLGAGRPDVPSPIAWSPDGRWIAYVQEVRPPARALPDGWLFRDGPPASSAVNPYTAPSAYRLWTTRPETGDSVLLEESRTPISGPAWSRDGASVAYSRLARGSDGASAIELVVQDAPDRRRVLHREPLTGPEPAPAAFRSLVPAWSPDGAWIASPRADPEGVGIVRVDDGKVERRLPGAIAPAWSPVANRLAYHARGPTRGLWVLDGVLAEPRKVAERFDTLDRPPPPAWDRDGRSLLVLRPSLATPNPGAPGRSGMIFHIAKVRVDGREADTSVEMAHDPVPGEADLAGVWLSITPEGEDAFYATASAGQVASQMTWAGRRFAEVKKRFNPFDASALIGAIAAGPEGRGVAFRVWSDGSWSPPAICRPVDESMILATPDEATRSDWLARLLDVAVPILSERFPAPALADDTAVDRPSLLPAPGEVEPSDPALGRLQKLGRMGRSVLGTPSPETAETRLALSYLAGEPRDADDALAILLEHARTGDERLRLRAVEAQIALMRRDFARAGVLIDYLRRAKSGPTHEVEDYLETRRTARLPDPRGDWARYLGERLKALKTPPAEPKPDLVPRDALDLDGMRAPVGGNLQPAAPF